MMKSMFLIPQRYLVLGFMLFFASTFLHGQVIDRNDEGDVIVTYKDGSWRYFMGTDSVLLMQEYQNFLRKEKGEIEVEAELVEEIETTTQNQNKQVDEVIDTSNPVDPVVELEEVMAVEEVVESVEEEPVKKVLTVDEEELLELTERRLTLTERLRRVESGYINLSEKEIRKVKEELSEINQKLNVPKEEEIDEELPPFVEKKSARYDKNNYTFQLASQDEKFETCDVTVERDEFTKRKTAAVRRAYFFQYTPEEMRQHLKGSHYLDAHAALAHVSGNTILSIYTEINTRSNQSGYGSLQKGSSMKLRLTNGEVITLYNSRNDNGRRDTVSNKYYYTGRYVLDKSAIKALERNDIESIRINWSPGYEDYDVYRVSLLRDQIKCLKSAL